MVRGVIAAVALAVVGAGCAGAAPEFVPAATAPAEPTPGASPAATLLAPGRTPDPPPPPPAPTPAPPLPGLACEWAEVLSVTDGDTLSVSLPGGTSATVRLIGVDAPEGGRPFAAQATEKLTRLAGGRTCLESDITPRDRLNRLLRYAWTADGTLINEALLAAGLAAVVTFPPDVKYLESRYLPAEAAAKAAGLGIWAAASAATPAGGDDGSDECDPAYPGVCIPPVSQVGDLDCGDIPFRRFRVLPPDPHRFDRDGDGVGCES